MVYKHTDTLPLTVHNTGFLLDKLGQDCHPIQFLRELTQNAIEAIQRTDDSKGEILWDVDWLPFELGEQTTYKLCITDNGDGMTGKEMVQYINQLSSSGSIQSIDGNYGIGAKISAATRNHHGLIYLSWKNGEGTMIHLWRDPHTKQYGLRQIERPDGSYGHYGSVEDDVKPEIINGRGTKIVLYGNSKDEDTMKAPPEAASPTQWIAKYLNTRYFRFPENLRIRARQGWEQPRSNKDVNLLRTLEGQESYLKKHSIVNGTVQLTDAVGYWWILKDESALTQNSGFIESSGHIAALFKDELYEMASGRAGYAKLQQFGVIFGQRQVVIYVEPVSKENNLATNTSRTQLLMNSEPLPWTDWAAEFRESMPKEINELMEVIAAKSVGSDHSKSIRDRLKSLMDLYKVSRYHPASAGPFEIGDPQPLAGGNPASNVPGTGTKSSSGNSRSIRGGNVGGVYSTFLKKEGQKGKEAHPNLFPTVRWVSVTDRTRQPGDIEDKAARYLQDQNLLLINADFRVFTDMIQYWQNKYVKRHKGSAGVLKHINESVRSWFEQALTETIIGLNALKGSREWSVKELENAVSEVSLTAVVMQRYHPFNCIKRELGTKIGSLTYT